MPHRLLITLATLAALLVLASPALAWVETHTVAYEARLEVDRQGNAKIEHAVRMTVAGGPLRSFDLKIADRNVALPTEAFLVNARDGMATAVPIPVQLEQRPDGQVRVDIDGKRGVGRGLYELRFSYTVDLLRQEAVSLDGSMLRLTWVGPKFDDGIDNMKLTVVVPSAPTEPRTAPFRVGGMGPDAAFHEAGAFLTTVVRGPQTDEITLLRPYVAKREPVAWSVRVDLKALGELNDPRLRPAPEPSGQEEALRPEARAMRLGLGIAGALVFALLVLLKHRDVTRSCRERGVEPRALVPLGIALRVALASPLLAGGVAWQLLADHPLGGTVLIVAAMALVSYVAPRRQLRARGPGRWLPMQTAELQRKSSSSWLDASTWPGRVALLLATVALGVGVWQLTRHSLYHAHLVALDGVVLLAVFGTGLRRWIPGDAVHATAKILSEVAGQLRGLADAKLGVIGRVPTGSKAPDELRLTVRAKHAMRGLIAMELGVGWYQGAGGPVALPQLLLRVADGSECHEQLTRRLGTARWVRGRDTHERVLVMSPSLPTADAAARLTRKLAGWVVSAPAAAQPARAVRSPQSRAAASSSRMSCGSSSSTAKPAMGALPFQDRW